MKALLEVVRLANDIVTTSAGPVDPGCPDDCFCDYGCPTDGDQLAE